MAQTYAQVMRQIDELRHAAETLRKKEAAEVVARIREAIETYQLTAADLFGHNGADHAITLTSKRAASAAGNGGAKVAAVKKAKKKAKAGRIKYRDDAGHAWSGYGPKPAWFREALAAGKSAEQLAVA